MNKVAGCPHTFDHISAALFLESLYENIEITGKKGLWLNCSVNKLLKCASLQGLIYFQPV